MSVSLNETNEITRRWFFQYLLKLNVSIFKTLARIWNGNLNVVGNYFKDFFISRLYVFLDYPLIYFWCQIETILYDLMLSKIKTCQPTKMSLYKKHQAAFGSNIKSSLSGIAYKSPRAMIRRAVPPREISNFRFDVRSEREMFIWRMAELTWNRKKLQMSYDIIWILISRY